MMIQNTLSRLFWLSTFCFVVGCAIKNPPQVLDNKVELPDNYQADSRSSETLDSLDYHDFFKDTVLVALIDTAIMNNYDLAVALERIKVADAAILRRKGQLAPEGFGFANVGGQRYGDYTEAGVGNYDTNFSENIGDDRRIPYPFTPAYNFGIGATWELDIWKKIQNMKKSALSNYLATREARQLIITDLVAKVASTYYNMLEKENELEIIEKNIALQGQAVELIKIQKLAGGVTELAVRQFSAQLLNSRSLEYSVRQEIYELEIELNFLLGRVPRTIVRGVGILEQQLPNMIFTGVPSDLLLNRPDLRQKEFELQAANANVYVARAAFYPSLNLTAALGFDAFRPQLVLNPNSIAAGILANLTAPIFNKKRIRADLKKAESENYILLYEYEKATLNALSEVLINLKGIENSQNFYELKVQQVDELRNAQLTSNDLFITGFANYLEVITAQAAVFEAELSLMKARNQQFLYVVDLYRSLGGGWKDVPQL